VNPAPTLPTLTIVTRQPSFGALVTPKAEINGHPVNLQWGSNHIGAPPGVHRIAIHVPWLWKFGRAEITVDNTAGPAPTVYYAMPWINFGSGAIGLEPVKSPGLVWFLLVILVPFVLLVLCCVGTSLLGD
jgi:hypothetical protein